MWKRLFNSSSAAVGGSIQLNGESYQLIGVVAEGIEEIYPNVDLYSASVYRYLAIPTDMFTPVFAASRIAGQAAHVLEQQSDNRIIRPSATYVGEPRRAYPEAS